MGSSILGRDEETLKALRKEQRIAAAEEGHRLRAQRMALADKIVMAVVDKIAADIIRPGPKPEERECYVMAKELREHSEQLKLLVMNILKVEKEERYEASG